MTETAVEHDPLVNAKIMADLDNALIALDAWERANPKPESYKFNDSAETKAAKIATKEAWTEARKPYWTPVGEARERLDLLHLPVGTRVSYYTEKGWTGGTRDRGVIVKVTRQSYLVERDSNVRKTTARIARDLDTISKSRRLTVINGPTVESMRREARERKAASWRGVMALDQQVRNAESEAYTLRRDRNEVLRSVGLLGEFGRNPAIDAVTDELIKRHQDEYDAMVAEALAACEARIPADTPTADEVAHAEAEVERLKAAKAAAHEQHTAMPALAFDAED